MRQAAKEQVFFLFTVAIVGAWWFFASRDPYRPMTARGGKPLAEDKVAALVVGRTDSHELAEGWLDAPSRVFAEPREWSPLPPVDLPLPPRREPQFLSPFPAPSPLVERRGVRRRSMEVVDFLAMPTASEEPRDREPSGQEFLTEQEALQRRYDWLEVRTQSEPLYGFIKNRDKFALLDDPTRDVEFRHVNPDRTSSHIEATVPRENILKDGIHFADTPANRVEQKLREIPESRRTAGSIPTLVALAKEAMTEGPQDPVAYRRVAEEIPRYLQLDAKEPGLYELLADCHRGLQDYEAERDVFANAESAGVESGGLAMRRVRWFWKYGARDHARELLQKAVKRHPESRELRLFRARCWLELEQTDAALNDLEMVKRMSQTAAHRREARLALVDALLRAARWDPAERELEGIQKVYQDDPEILLLEGRLHYARGNDSAAGEAFLRALQLSVSPRTSSLALLGKALAHAQRGEYAEADQDLQAVARLDPLRGAAIHGAMAFVHELSGRASAALEASRRAVAMDPKDRSLLYSLGRQLRKAGEWDEAREVLRKALQHGPGFSELFNELGFLELESRRPEEAVRYLAESLANDPRDETRELLAHAHTMAGDWRQALDLLESVRPSAGAYVASAYCQYRQGNSAEAQRRLQSVLTDLSERSAEEEDYARVHLADILDRESKQEWVDRIPWNQISNGWRLEDRYDIRHEVRPGEFRFVGNQRVGSGEQQLTYLSRPVDVSRFFELEMDLSSGPDHQGRFGIALVDWRTGTGAPQARVGLFLAVGAEGTVETMKREHLDDPGAVWTPWEGERVSSDSVRLSIRRPTKGRGEFEFAVNGIPIGEAVELQPWRGDRRRQVSAVFFVSAPSGQSVSAALHSVRIIEFLPL